MSIDLNWETLTTGPDGEALADRIRDFIHTKFQSVPLPRFIKSVTVHDFEFGTIPPELELKDITDPLPDFYEDNPAADGPDSDDGSHDDEAEQPHLAPVSGRPTGRTPVSIELGAVEERRRKLGQSTRLTAIPPHTSTAAVAGSPYRGALPVLMQDLGSPFLGTSTPGIPGGTSNLNYFHSHLMGGPSGTQTPLAAVAGAHLGNNNRNHHWTPEPTRSSPLSSTTTAALPETTARQRSADSRTPSHSRNPSQGSISISDLNNNPPIISGLTRINPGNTALREKSSVSTFAPTSRGTSRPPTRDNANTSTSILAGSAIAEDDELQDGEEHKAQCRFREPRVEDVQAVFRIKYSGNVKLLLTADILLDYPMPSFVGIPLRLSITGLSFDGVGVVAYIRKRVHFCFLSPEDALAAVSSDSGEPAADVPDGPGRSNSRPGKMGGLLQEIRVESEIGQRAGGKQSLKNVGKVERFVLEQVRRIFEEELVYPSFWTFLV